MKDYVLFRKGHGIRIDAKQFFSRFWNLLTSFFLYLYEYTRITSLLSRILSRTTLIVFDRLQSNNNSKKHWACGKLEIYWNLFIAKYNFKFLYVL